MGRRVTIQQVAVRAGVSASTVSRTLHNHPRISDETKQRVIEAAEALNYRPGSPFLASGGAQFIAVILPATTPDLARHPFFASVLQGISRAAQQAGYYPSYAYAGSDDSRIETVNEYLKTPAVRWFVLVAAYVEDRCLDYLVESDAHLCVIGRPGRSDGVQWVDNDNFHASYDAATVLIEHGLRKIAFLGGPSQMNVTRDRFEGFRMALANRGLHQHPPLIAYADEFSEDGGKRAMAAVLESEIPDGLIASDDFLAMGAEHALRDRGLEMIPMIGFNNTKWGPQTGPPFSSVEIFPEELGSNAARLLINSIEQTAVEEDHLVVPTRIVLRGALAASSDVRVS